MRYLIIALLMTGCINMTPRQEALLHTPEPPVFATAQELRELLPAFAEIPDGTYQLIPRGTMPAAEWQNVFVSDIMMPKDWDCKDFSWWADSMMPVDAAFGTAWNDNHMVNWFVDEKGTVVLFEPQDYNFIRLPITGMKI